MEISLSISKMLVLPERHNQESREETSGFLQVHELQKKGKQ